MRTIGTLLLTFGLALFAFNASHAGFERFKGDSANGLTKSYFVDPGSLSNETTTECTNNPSNGRPGNHTPIEQQPLQRFLDEYRDRFSDNSNSASTTLTGLSDPTNGFNPYDRPQQYPYNNPPTTTTTDNGGGGASTTPEPATFLMMGLGAIALIPVARKYRRSPK